MKLNPVYTYIKEHKRFSLSDIIKSCHGFVVDTQYLKDAFFYFAQLAYVLPVGKPLPEKNVLWESAIPDIDAMEKSEELIFKEETRKHWGYRVFDWNENPDFFKMGKFEKTELFAKDFKNMKEPFLTRPFGTLVDLASPSFKKKYYTNGLTYHDNEPYKEKWSSLSYAEVSKRTRSEIERALFYMAVQHHDDQHGDGFALVPNDRKYQWQRVVDLGIEYDHCKKYGKLTKREERRCAFEMFKMHWMVNSETENMC